MELKLYTHCYRSYEIYARKLSSFFLSSSILFMSISSFYTSVIDKDKTKTSITNTNDDAISTRTFEKRKEKKKLTERMLECSLTHMND
jgi:hypothetical protein